MNWQYLLTQDSTEQWQMLPIRGLPTDPSSEFCAVAMAGDLVELDMGAAESISLSASGSDLNLSLFDEDRDQFTTLQVAVFRVGMNLAPDKMIDGASETDSLELNSGESRRGLLCRNINRAG